MRPCGACAPQRGSRPQTKVLGSSASRRDQGCRVAKASPRPAPPEPAWEVETVDWQPSDESLPCWRGCCVLGDASDSASARRFGKGKRGG